MIQKVATDLDYSMFVCKNKAYVSWDMMRLNLVITVTADICNQQAVSNEHVFVKLRLL